MKTISLNPFPFPIPDLNLQCEKLILQSEALQVLALAPAQSLLNESIQLLINVDALAPQNEDILVLLLVLDRAPVIEGMKQSVAFVSFALSVVWFRTWNIRFSPTTFIFSLDEADLVHCAQMNLKWKLMTELLHISWVVLAKPNSGCATSLDVH